MARQTRYDSRTDSSPDERSPTRDENTRTNTPASSRGFRSTSDLGCFGNWTFRSRRTRTHWDVWSDSEDSRDEEAAELSDDEGFWNMSRRASAQQLEPAHLEPTQTLRDRARGVLGDITTSAINRLSNFSGTQTRELIFDDESLVIIFDGDEEREHEVAPQFDFAVPIGPRVQESYRFEVEHPTAAPAIRYLHGIPTARHLAVVSRGLHRHSAVGLTTLTGAYDRVAETYTIAAENIQPALRIGWGVAADVVEEARGLRDAAQEQWREWSPWLDRMFEETATGPGRPRRASLMR
ncbi:unnamed protein product [Clonostachys byssicola]|uniref:Uncharacterized protein n=1 Tax=Clonostachys byssicola TaxID=160290 RepID=A0A9N9U368_9HYPO|nr:unnamed protein product [Clonostachys byssicola]